MEVNSCEQLLNNLGKQIPETGKIQPKYQNPIYQG